MKKLINLCGLTLFAHLLAVDAAPYEARWESLDHRPTPEWYLDAKFGLFIHWGVYSVPSWGAPQSYAEWYWNKIADKKADNVWWQFHKANYGASFDYQEFAPLFRAELFNADQWAELFVRCGAKYIVPTSKHHEGFCLWPSAEASRTWGRPWNSVEVGPKRDLLGELALATRKRGLKFGFYYSLYEWFNPLWLSDRKRYVTEHMTPQFKDVVTRYQPAIIFSDGEWDLPSADWNSEALLAWLFNESSCKDEVVVNDRWGKETRHKHGTYFTTEYGAGMKDAAHPWEESRGMGYSYGCNRAENIDDYKSARELILVLIDLVSRGGNFLLDIGPTGDGRIPVIMQQRLGEIGDWLKVNGEAIYGSRHAGRDCQWTGGKRPGQEFGEYKIKYNLMEQIGHKPKGDLAVKMAFFTKKPDALYAITPGWPGAELVLRDIDVPADSVVTLLGVEGPLKYQTAGKTLTIQVPALNVDQVPCRYAYTFKVAGAKLLPEAPAQGQPAAPTEAKVNRVQYSASPTGSMVKIEGPSTIHDWTMESRMVPGTLELDSGVQLDAAPATIAGLDGNKVPMNVKVSIPVRTLKSYATAMDNVYLDAMEEKTYPKIEYSLTELTVKEGGHNAGPPLAFTATGDLVVHGVTNRIAMPVTIEVLDGNRLRIRGSTSLKMTAFKVQPPSPKWLPLKTGNDIKVIFEWLVIPKKEAAK